MLAAVRQQLLATEPGSAHWATLFSWVKPQLLAMAETMTRTPAPDRPISHDVNTIGGTVTVTPDGPDTKRMGEVLNQLATEDSTLRTQLIGGVAATAVPAAIAIVAALNGHTGVAVFLLVLAAVAAALAIRAQLVRSAGRREGAAVVA